jgi:hypothetical protein
MLHPFCCWRCLQRSNYANISLLLLLLQKLNTLPPHCRPLLLLLLLQRHNALPFPHVPQMLLLHIMQHSSS